MQVSQDADDPELLALADATDRVADGIGDLDIRRRLHGIAEEVRALARRNARVEESARTDVSCGCDRGEECGTAA